MSVIGFGKNYRKEYLKLEFNGLGQVRTIIFDNREILKNIDFGEKYTPEIYNSAAGFASKAARIQPMRMKVNFKIAYPATVGKLNDMIAFTKSPYKLKVWLNGFGEWPAFSPYWVDNIFTMPAVLEYDKELFWRKNARGEGFVRDEEVSMVFHEAADLVIPSKPVDTGVGILVLLGDGGTKPIILKNAEDITIAKLTKS